MSSNYVPAIPVENIVNFDSEFEKLTEPIVGVDSKRLIFIKAENGRGKTTLLRKFLKYCQEKSVPCSLIDFESERYNQPHYFLAKDICEQLGVDTQQFDKELIPIKNIKAGGNAQTNIE